MRLPSLKKSLHMLIAGTITTFSAFTLGGFWSNAFRNISTVLSNKKPDINIPLTEIELEALRQPIQDSYKYITAAYNFEPERNKQGEYILDFKNFSEKEIEYAKDALDKCKIIDFCDDKSGLKALALKDTTNGNIILAIAGAATGPFKEFRKDYFDALNSSAGALTEQFAPLYEFSQKLKKEHGKIDIIAGHSLGGHLATCLSPAFSDALIISCDGPGKSFALLHNLRKFYSKEFNKDISEQDIRSATSHVIRFFIEQNVYNAIGIEARDVTSTLPRGTSQSFPEVLKNPLRSHIHSDDPSSFFGQMAKGVDKLYSAPNNYSHAPMGVTAILLFLSIGACASPSLSLAKRGYSALKKKRENGTEFNPEMEGLTQQRG